MISPIKSTLVVMMMAVAATIFGLFSVADGLLLLTALLMLMQLVWRPTLPHRAAMPLLAFALYLSVFWGFTLASPTEGGIKNSISAGIAAIFFFYFCGRAWQIVNLPYFSHTLFSSGVAFSLTGIVFGTLSKNTVSGIVAYLFISSGIVSLSKGGNLLKVSFGVFSTLFVIGFALDHRLMSAAALMSIFIVMLFLFLPSRFVKYAVIGGVSFIIFVFIALYANLWGFNITDWDGFFKEYSGRTAASGRQKIWPIITSAVSQNFWTGLGTGVAFRDIFNSNWSAHSYFMQTLMQTGMIGVSTLVFLLFALWQSLGRPRRAEPTSIFTNTAFVLLLVHISFEVFLMQVSLVMGCLAWMMLGLAIGLRTETRVKNDPFNSLPSL